MQRYLFQVSIGPVQNFIAAARRTRDLKFGSELLSELSKAAAKAITTNAENVLIFPTPPNPKSLEPNSEFNAANKIVALTNGSPKDLGRDVYDAIRARLLKFRTEAKGFRELPEADQKTADAQLNDLVEYFWVALPFQEGRYKVTRENLEALMAARKNTRVFSRVEWGSSRQKSSIDGQLESVIPEGWYPHRWENATTQRTNANKLFKSFHAKPGEHLSGVDLLKRNGRLPMGDSFPSTSHLATIPFLERLKTLDNEAIKQLKQAWDTYIQELEKVARIEYMPRNSPLHPVLENCEGSMLLEERLTDLVDVVDDMQIFDDAKKALHTFFEQVDKQFPNAAPKVRPGIYYAILLADGDSMGKVIDHEAEQGSWRHQQLSRKLAEFSESVRSIVESKGNQGSLIYAGGDDVLAFMPLHTVLQCAQKLAETFYNNLKDFHDSSGKSPTLSVGVAVTHHLQPLREALELARSAENSAKHVKDKNALAITISKRSGSDFTIRGYWTDFYKNLEKLIGFCREGAIPEGTAFELRSLSLRLADQTGSTDSATLLEIIEAEAKRILQRKLSFWRSNQAQAGKKQILEDTHKQIIAMLADFVKNGRTADEPPIEHFANILIAAQFFADAMELAQPTKGAQQ